MYYFLTILLHVTVIFVLEVIYQYIYFICVVKMPFPDPMFSNITLVA